MRVASLAIVIGFSSLLCGCASDKEMQFSSGTGDVESFIFEKAIAFGGQPKTPSSAPGRGGSWSYAEDKHGVVIRTDSKRYSDLELFLRGSFGVPGFNSPEKDGFRLLQYRLTEHGGGIQLTCDSQYTQVIIIKPWDSKVQTNTH